MTYTTAIVWMLLCFAQTMDQRMSNTRKIISKQDATPPFFVGVDLGGTNVKVGLVDDNGNTLAFRSIPTRVPDGAEAGTQRMAQAVEQVIEKAGLQAADITRVGLGSPGTMDIPAGMLLKPVNLLGWNNYPIRDRLSEYCGHPVTFANDANAASLGEYWVGSAAEFQSMVLFTLGTGVGGGIVLNGNPIDGANSHGGELGHVIIDTSPDARVCSCGQLGHIEAYSSATGLIKRTRDALGSGRQSSMLARLESGEELTPILIGDEANAGDELAMELIMETARLLGISAVQVMHTVDPEAIIYGGAMTFGREDTVLGRKFLSRIKEEINRLAFPVLSQNIQLRYATLGGDAGYIGAAACARRDYRRLAGQE